MKCVCLVGLSLLACACALAQVEVAVRPAQPLLDVSSKGQHLSVDFAVTNHEAVTMRLVRIDAEALDGSGALMERRTVNSNGLSPGIAVVGVGRIETGQTADVFNPFDLFAAEMPVVAVRFVFFLDREADATAAQRNRSRSPEDWDVRVPVTVRPVRYKDRVNLRLPMRGPLFVWDGHDALSHHRRVPLDDAKVRGMGIVANSNRYAVDLVVTDASGAMHRQVVHSREDWFCYGAPIYAPGAGVVVEARGDLPENDFLEGRMVEAHVPEGADPRELGNHVLIDHGNGEFSLLLHMKQGSVRVKSGQRVRAGDRIGQVGFSGDAIFPHLHYALMNGPKAGAAEGLPAYFHGFDRLWGGRKVAVNEGEVEGGDLVLGH